MSEPVINIDVPEAVAAVARGAYLLDVREDDEWAAGRAPEARHIRLSELPDRFSELPRDHAIVCICRAGGRSARAASFLAEQGFEAFNVEGGMQSWASLDFALISDEDEPSII